MADRYRRRRLLPRWRFALLLPVSYNPDDPLHPSGLVEGHKFVEVEERLVARFGGFTKLGAAEVAAVVGQWQDQETGITYADRHWRYEVVCERRTGNTDFVLDLHVELLALFRQEEIFLTRDAMYLAL